MRVNSECCSIEYLGWHRASVLAVDHPLSSSCRPQVNLHWQTHTEDLETWNKAGGKNLNLAVEPEKSEEDTPGMVSRMLVLVCWVHFRGWTQVFQVQKLNLVTGGSVVNLDSSSAKPVVVQKQNEVVCCPTHPHEGLLWVGRSWSLRVSQNAGPSY